MRITKLLVAAAGVWALAVTPAWANHGAGDLYNCANFDFQEDAQAHMDAHPGDPDGLDGNDNDGRACEALPSRGGGTTPAATPTTVGSTATVTPGAAPAPAPAAGRQPLARTGSENGQLATVATVLVASGLVLVAAGRRRRCGAG